MPDTDTTSAPADVREIASDGSRFPWLCDQSLDFVTPQLGKVLRVWDAKRGRRELPRRADFEMRDLRFALPNVAFVAVVFDQGRLRFRVRLMGSQLDHYVGEMTGRFIDDVLPPPNAQKWSSIWSAAIELRRPQRSAGRVELGGKNYYVFEKLCAPLADGGVEADGILVATYYHACEGDCDERDGIGPRIVREIESARPGMPSRDAFA